MTTCWFGVTCLSPEVSDVLPKLAPLDSVLVSEGACALNPNPEPNPNVVACLTLEESDVLPNLKLMKSVVFTASAGALSLH